jgi:hypothetical protein
MKLRRLRDGDVLEDGDIVLVRGGDRDPDILSEDAVRYHGIYGVYGISVFAVGDATILARPERRGQVLLGPGRRRRAAPASGIGDPGRS